MKNARFPKIGHASPTCHFLATSVLLMILDTPLGGEVAAIVHMPMAAALKRCSSHEPEG